MLPSGDKLSKKIVSSCDSSKNIDARKLCKNLIVRSSLTLSQFIAFYKQCFYGTNTGFHDVVLLHKFSVVLLENSYKLEEFG